VEALYVSGDGAGPGKVTEAVESALRVAWRSSLRAITPQAGNPLLSFEHPFHEALVDLLFRLALQGTNLTVICVHPL